MNKRYRVPAPLGVAVGIWLVMFGLFNLFSQCKCIYENERFRRNADKVIAECTMVGDGTNNPKSYLKSTVAFLYNGKKYENVVIDNYAQLILREHKVELYVNPDNPRQSMIEYKSTEGIGETYIVFIIMGLGTGPVMVIVGISRMRHSWLF